jgi:glycosyltransferase involved in cell wall biosynthesis
MYAVNGGIKTGLGRNTGWPRAETGWSGGIGLKILHLYSDWKWTGPAEPAIQACRSLMDRGHEVIFACCEPPPEYFESVKQKALDLDLNVTTRFKLDRHMHPWNTLHDLATLPVFMRRQKVDIVHCHLSHDHGLGTRCTHWSWSGRPPLVRSLYKRSVLKPSWLNRWLLKSYTDGYVTFTDSFRDDYIHRFQLPPDRVVVSPMSIDLDRFRPDRPFADMRAKFGIAPDAPVIGIVGRFQKYRRAEVFIEAAHRVLQEAPEARFVIIGRSGQLQKTVIEPIRRLGIEQQVILTGYLTDEYADTLASLDIFTLLMPGFDGTARAVREAMALAKPCVVSNYGMLPEIVPHDVAGLSVPPRPEELAAGWLRLIRDDETRRRMGMAARRHAEENFRIDTVGPCLETLYERLLGARATDTGND